MTTNFKVNGIDVDEFFVRKDLFTQGGLWGWGDNSYGQLGNNSNLLRSSPVQTVSGGVNWKQVSGGLYHSAGIKSDGTLWLWGRNSEGQLGDTIGIDRSSPVQTVSGGINWIQVEAGYYHTAGLKTDGTLWLWGQNNNGQVGDGTTTNVFSPVQTVAGGTAWRQVSCSSHTAGIKTDGTLWLWGSNLFGALGDGSTVHRSSPVQTTSAGTNWKQVACTQWMTAAIKTDGTLWTWGYNQYGQLGDDTVTNRSAPGQISGTNWKQVATGTSFAAAIKTDGTLWLWGRALRGVLGNNDQAFNQSSPVQTVAGGTNWRQVSCGDFHTTAIKTDGSLWTWGYNAQGQLGDNTTTDKSSPIQTVAAGTNWKIVGAGWNFTLGIRENYWV